MQGNEGMDEVAKDWNGSPIHEMRATGCPSLMILVLRKVCMRDKVGVCRMVERIWDIWDELGGDQRYGH